jgi:ABC-type lipoprotein release transport system permease subunit
MERLRIFSARLRGLFRKRHLDHELEAEIRAHDPFLLGAALFVLLAVAFFAAWIPARKAMRVDPMIALRYE